MRRTAWKHWVTGLVLLTFLTALAPVPAHAAAAWSAPAAPTALAGWPWIAAFWERLAAWILGGGAPRTTGHGVLIRKDAGDDPVSTADPSNAAPADDSGVMIDPNG